MLIVAEGIRQKVIAADLAGNTGAPKLTPEEQEVMDENGPSVPPSLPVQVPNTYGPPLYPPGTSPVYAGSPGPDGPTILYVATLSDSERKAALRNAFATAKRSAAELAEAAGGMGLGRIESLRSGVNSFVFFSSAAPTTSSDDYPPPGGKDDAEVTSPTPAILPFSISVTANFRLLPANSNSQ